MTRRRWYLLAGAGLLVVLAAAAVFRPDKLFVDQRVDEELSPDLAAALEADAGSSTTSSSVPDAAPITEAAPPPPPSTTTVPVPVVVGEGAFVAQGGHRVSGRAVVIEDGGVRTLVLPELDAENGPDLQLYLSPVASGSVDGGLKIAPLKGNIGTQTYELPADVDLQLLQNVVIWCERFAVPFGSATLT